MNNMLVGMNNKEAELRNVHAHLLIDLSSITSS